LVAGVDGVKQVREGEVIGTPVLSATQVAIGDGVGGMVVLPADAERWPDPFSGGGSDQLWRVTPDGSARLLYEAPGRIVLFDVVVVAPVSAAPSVVFTEERLYVAEDTPAGYGHELDWVMVLPLDGNGHPSTVVAPVGSWAGGVRGVARQDDRFIMSMGAEGSEWMGAWAVSGEPLPWPANPFPHDRPWDDTEPVFGQMAGIPGTRTIVFTELRPREAAGEPFFAPADLVEMDTVSGAESLRREVSAAGEAVVRLYTDQSRVAITRITLGYQYLPVRIVNLVNGVIEDVEAAGLATIVRG
jgi:hypothetical protein